MHSLRYTRCGCRDCLRALDQEFEQIVSPLRAELELLPIPGSDIVARLNAYTMKAIDQTHRQLYWEEK